jgi:hypothetical protein
MKINMYMYDKEIDLNEEATEEFLQQYENAKGTMRQLLNIFEDEETRLAMFYMMSLRTLIDDFLEFCTEDIDVDLMSALLNNEDIDDEEFENDEDDEGEIFVDFDKEE